MTASTSTRTRRRPTSLNALDIETLRFITRFQYVRGAQIAQWTGASPWTIRKRLRGLVDHHLVTSSVLSVYLRDGDNRIVPSQASVWRVNPRGAELAGEWPVPGTAQRISLPGGGGRSRLMSDHVVGVADLAGWYRSYGFEVAAEREILSLERPVALPRARRAAVSADWSVRIPGHTGIHAPDMGAVDPAGAMWAIELERATKTVEAYQEVIGAYRAAGLGQVWHILSGSTARRVMEACTRLGVIWAPPPLPGVSVSHDGLVRLGVWRPGRVVGPRGPADWPSIPRVPPAGFVDLARIDQTATWRMGVPVNVHDPSWESIGGIVP